MIRAAWIRSPDAELVQAYLPSNYAVLSATPSGEGLLVVGTDDHGWTLDGYVLPRLGSALIPGTEIQVRTEYVYPPIPVRMFDWAAHLDGCEEDGSEFGRTEQEAVAALLEREADRRGW